MRTTIATPALAPVWMEHFRRRLSNRRVALILDTEALEREGALHPSPESAVHAVETGADRLAQSVSLGCLESVTRDLREIEDALLRIRTGTYGCCERCGGMIGRPRLEAIPYARYCLPCQQREEAA